MKRLIPILLICASTTLTSAENGAKADSKEGFVRIPAGKLEPGCTKEDYKNRANDAQARALYIFDVWGKYGPVTLPAYRLQQYELTNAQWKLYLDRNFRVKVETTGQQTLEALADKHIRHQDEPIKGQWPSIYALNWKTIYEALKDKTVKRKDAQGREIEEALWDPSWRPDRPGDGLAKVFLPEGLTLEFYSHVVPRHWYGWSKLSKLSSGREYVDVRAAPKDAFIRPDGEMFEKLRLRTKDFKNYPARGMAPLEALAMAEWAGCDLPTEYEMERAMRGGAPNAKQQPGPAPWNHNKQREWFSWADNPKTKTGRGGPLPVDDPSVAKGDSEFGCRHLLGNVWELTSTFWDLHPYLPAPKPDPAPSQGLFNYALIAKGGAWGSGWRQIQISTRTGNIGGGLDLKYLNRADSLGIRLARHDQPCYDLLNHTIRRMALNRNLGMWSPVPHAFARPRFTGADVTHFVESSADEGYCFVQDKAIGIGVAPLWVTKIDKTVINGFKKDWKNPKKEKAEFIDLGILRLDAPIKAGVALNAQQWADLVERRKVYLKLKREAEQQKKKRKKKGVEPIVVPDAPPPPDKYEKATVKQAEYAKLQMARVWREKQIEAGEYRLVYWYGFIGLTGRSRRMPPQAILIPESVKDERKIGEAKGKTELLPEKKQVRISFAVEEWIRGKPQLLIPPKADQSDLWALCKTLPEGWPGRKVNKKGWRFNVLLEMADDVLTKHKWNVEAEK
ncbi:MAG: formylglycine-generating enzyme family protein [Planctomycetota bacterium]